MMMCASSGLRFRDPQALNREDYKTFQAQLKPIQNAIDAVLKLPGTYDDLNPQLQARRMHFSRTCRTSANPPTPLPRASR